MVQRHLVPRILARLFKGKAILLFGPRQVGKSTMIEAVMQQTGLPWLQLNGDEADIRSQLSNTTSTRLKAIFGQYTLVLIDEAQRIDNIGLTLKLITDQIKNVQVIATGSSAFELANAANESLTGRKYEYFLYPISFGEMVATHGLLNEKRLIEHRLVYGYYPEIVSNQGKERELLKLVAGSYLYKDILMLEKVKKPVLLEKLLKALALQLGSEVNYHELSQMVEADKGTVEKYIDLLEKAYVIFRLPALNRNVRSELKKGKKVYFYDCGIRNAILGNYNNLANRTDVGALWENFVIAERIKYMYYKDEDFTHYFWRTTRQQEIDFIEETPDSMLAFECKWNPKAKANFPDTFTEGYPNAKTMVITPENIESLLGF
jgi:predicted AAA+ superfamily ATPase